MSAELKALRIGRIVAVQEGSADVELEATVRVGDVVYSSLIDQRIKDKLGQFADEAFKAEQRANSLAAQWGIAQIEIAKLRNDLNGALADRDRWEAAFNDAITSSCATDSQRAIHQVAMPNALGDLRWYDVTQADYNASLPHLRRVVQIAPTPAPIDGGDNGN